MEETMEGLDSADPRIYEVGYHLISNVPEESIPAESAKIKEVIVSFGGVILSEEEAKFLRLAYRVDKTVGNKRAWFDSAYFGWIKFEAEPGVPIKLKKFMEENKNILRCIIIKTVRENTMVKKSLLAAKPPIISSGAFSDKSLDKDVSAEKSDTPAPLPIVDEEALDKQIDELVIQ